VRALVAPKKRAEAEAVPDAQLAAWLAADGMRVRRPIVAVGGELALGFAAEAKAKLAAIAGD